MEEALIISQTLFYFVASFAIIAISLIFAVIVYYVVQIGKHLNRISQNIETASGDVKENIREFFNQLSNIPFISSFFKKGRSK